MPKSIYKHKPLTKGHKTNISKALKGKMPKFIPNNKGIKRTEAQKKKISKTLKKKGIKPPRPPREKLCRGSKHRWWKGGISPVNETLRKSPEYKLWRKSVFERDKYTCIWCSYRGNELHADHIKPLERMFWGNEVESDIKLGETKCK